MELGSTDNGASCTWLSTRKRWKYSHRCGLVEIKMHGFKRLADKVRARDFGVPRKNFIFQNFAVTKSTGYEAVLAEIAGFSRSPLDCQVAELQIEAGILNRFSRLGRQVTMYVG